MTPKRHVHGQKRQLMYFVQNTRPQDLAVEKWNNIKN